MTDTYILIGKIVVWFGVACLGAFMIGLIAASYMWLSWKLLQYRENKWEYGTISARLNCSPIPARRHKRTGNIQMLLWREGEQGYKKDFYYPTTGHEDSFKLN